MNLTPRPSRQQDEDTSHLPLTTLIDVVFLLLIYFLLTASLIPPESELSAALHAEQQDAGAADLQPQIVTVTTQGGEPRFQIGTHMVESREMLTELLRELPTEAGVFIRVRDHAPVHAAAAALQASRDAGFVRISYVPAD